MITGIAFVASWSMIVGIALFMYNKDRRHV